VIKTVSMADNKKIKDDEKSAADLSSTEKSRAATGSGVFIYNVKNIYIYIYLILFFI